MQTLGVSPANTTARACFTLAVVVVAIGAVGGCVICDEAGEGCFTPEARLHAFDPGPGAGFGADLLPDVVEGLPDGGKTSEGSTHVLSLGVGGSITMQFSCPVLDGDGVDFVVYENAFFVGGGEGAFVEAGLVEVSVDGEDYVAFDCTAPDVQVAVDDGVDGCAGMAVVAANAENGLAGVFPDGGGDGFDIASVGLDAISFVRITDLSAGGAAPSAGFDLDAVVARRR
jgi:hypothetical protein